MFSVLSVCLFVYEQLTADSFAGMLFKISDKIRFSKIVNT